MTEPETTDRAFFRWLPLQKDRTDKIGELARAYCEYGRYFLTIKDFEAIMVRPAALDALAEALGYFDAERERLGMPCAPPIDGFEE